MTTSDNPANDITATTRPASGLVRWISVITLGCSLGLLVVLVGMNTRVVRANHQDIRVIYRAHPAETPFNLSGEPVEKELTRVIESQLAAFRNDDYPEAYKFAASPLKDHMSLPVFERMVKSGYPLIAHSQSARFGVILDNGNQAVVNATVSGVSGHTRHYRYILDRERTGWKISGVTEVNPSGTTI